MKEKLIEMKNELDYLSEEILSVENEKSRLIQAEEELHFLFRKNNRLLQELKYEWKTGEMSFIIHDTEVELNQHERKAIQSVEDEIHSLKEKEFT
ncbi:DUF3958 family protein [Pseudogracilibacillus auburnensis]|uniref:Uncharacterized protein n=1 Tax=Pseudogracilibacillus auburnensis TaxID=1494959 RepID=A0A2V3VZM1_9BACI|nr:DUF3958 family protein [Pseudogracilibacillus auburnensis]PXW86351.1 hypothetical protein DFR56_108170 [Pseudogracilibacillus auburnensis]